MYESRFQCMTSARIEKYGPDFAEKHRKSKKHGSSIPANRFTDHMYLVLIEADGNLEKAAIGYSYRAPSSNS